MEALLGDLVLFAGFNPMFVRDDESAVDALAQRRPDLVLIDAALLSGVRIEYERVALASGIAIVYFASTMGDGELQSFAKQRGAPYFPLPNGPKLLRSTLNAVLADGSPDLDGVPPVPPEVQTALRSIVTSRRLVADLASLRRRNAQTRADIHALLSSARYGRDLLHEAVTRYTSALRKCGTTHKRARELVRRLVRENVELAGAPEALPSILEEAAAWVDQVYRAA